MFKAIANDLSTALKELWEEDYPISLKVVTTVGFLGMFIVLPAFCIYIPIAVSIACWVN